MGESAYLCPQIIAIRLRPDYSPSVRVAAGGLDLAELGLFDHATV
ncbi:MAG: hypothetical protein ACE5IP_08340 [Terriglobia bacterium]